MRFEHVCIVSVVHVDAPVRLSSADITHRLGPALDRFGIRGDLLEDVAGIRERRVWGGPMPVSDAATMAGEKALAVSGVPPSNIGVLISTSVCRDYIEPSTASVVHGNLGLPDTCQNFDIGNACLAFLNGMDLAAYMIERADIEYALIVDGEVSDPITESTIERLNSPGATADSFRAEFASVPRHHGSDGHRHQNAARRGAETGREDLSGRWPHAGLGGRRAR